MTRTQRFALGGLILFSPLIDNDAARGRFVHAFIDIIVCAVAYYVFVVPGRE